MAITYTDKGMQFVSYISVLSIRSAVMKRENPTM
jgi:hypothetical protein